MPTSSTSSTANTRQPDVSEGALDRHLDEALTMAVALSDGPTAAALEALLYARQRSRAGDERAHAYMAAAMKDAVSFKDACGESSVVMSSASQLSPLNRMTSLKEARRSDAFKLLTLWNCVGVSGVAKPKLKPGSFSDAEWEEASVLARLLAQTEEAAHVEALLAAHSERVCAMGLAMQALNELVTDILLLSLGHPRHSARDEVRYLFPALMSARAQGLTPEGLIMLVDRALGLPTTRNYFSYRRTLKDEG